MFKKFPFAMATMAIVVVSTLDARAESNEEKELGAVTIGASRSQSRVEEMPVHTTIISQEEIQKSPAQTLDQLLRTVPGMNFTGVPAALSDPTGQQTKMRGMGNAKVLVLLDGVPIHDPFYLTTQWYKVPLSNIERVEVVRGGNSSLWGNMAVAGVVNIISKRPASNSGELVVSAGSQGSRNVALSKNFVVSDALSFNLTIDQYHSDGYQTTPSEYLWRFPGKKPIAAEDSNLQLTTFFKPSDSLSGYLRLGYHIQDQDISYQHGSNVQKTPDLALSLTKLLDKSSSITANAWAQYVNFEKFNGNSCYFQPGNTCPSPTNVNTGNINGNVVQFYTQYGSLRYREQGGSAIYSKNMSGVWNSFQLGVDYRHLSATDAERFYGDPNSLSNPQNFKNSTSGRGEQTFNGLFGQTKLFPIDPLEITISGRYDVWANTARNNTRTTAAGVTSGGAITDATTTAFSPSVAARYELSDQASLRGAAYKAFRAPGFNNTMRTFGVGSQTTIANPNLEPEKLTGWELGGDLKSGNLSLGATYFFNAIKSMITTYTVNANAAAPAQVMTFCGPVNGSNQFTACDNASSVKYYTNDQDGESHGVEMTANWKLGDTLNLNASYTHTETFLTRRGSVVTDPLGVQLVGVPKDTAMLGATWRPFEKLRTYAEAVYIGPMLLDTTSLNSTMRLSQGSNTVINLSATYALDKQTDLFASMVNVFDRQYSENAYAFNQPFNRTLSMPRAVTGGVKFRF